MSYTTYIRLCKLLRFFYTSKKYKYKPIKWTPIKKLQDIKYTKIDKLPLIIKLYSNLLDKYKINMPDNYREDIITYETEMKREIGSKLPIESENIESLFDAVNNKTDSFFIEYDINGNKIIDFSFMELFKVRNEFYNYGGKIFIGNNKIDKIIYNGITYYEIPYFLDLIIKSTIAVICVIGIHLIRLHLNTAQKYALKFRKYEKNHKYINFLQLCTFNTLTVNRNTLILIPILKNITAFTEEGFNDFIKYFIDKGEFKMKEIMGSNNTIWNMKMTQYRKKVDNLLLKLELIDETIIDTDIDPDYLRTFFLCVTAGHNQFGDSMIENLTIKCIYPPKVSKNYPGKYTLIEIEELKTIAYLVSSRPPLLIDKNWIKYFDIKYHNSIINFIELIKNENEGWFTPAYFEISIAV